MSLLDIKNLHTHFPEKGGVLKAVDGLHLKVNKGETVALVGESGSGKSVTALSILRLVPPPGQIVKGQVFFNDVDLLSMPAKEMQAIRGRRIGLVLQDPLSALNPVMRVGEQIAEVFRYHFNYSRKKARHEALAMMEIVQLENAQKIYSAYPHELSGGLRQRVLIGIALACRPELLIADEPTTALDVTIQKQILDLLKKLQNEFKLSLLLITHDLGIVSELADVVAVMYAGQIVEQARVKDLFRQPLHPYTQMLLNARPKVNFEPIDKIHTFKITASQDSLQTGSGCKFAERCAFVEEHCNKIVPEKLSSEGRLVKCIK